MKKFFIRPSKKDDDSDDDDYQPRKKQRETSIVSTASNDDTTLEALVSTVTNKCTPTPSSALEGGAATLKQSDRIAGELKSYQLEGVEWATHRIATDGTGVILADEMGLGKTVQAIATIEALKKTHTTPGLMATLVVCPLSVVQSWVNEVKFFAKHLKALRYIGSRDERDEMIAQVEEGLNSGRLTALAPPLSGLYQSGYDIIITTPEQVLSESFFLSKLGISTIVFDEAHRLKNPNSKLYKLFMDQYTHVHQRLLLTGTPLANHPLELWSLLRFANPRMFEKCTPVEDACAGSTGTAEAKSTLEQPAARSALSDIKNLLMLRRLKKDVLKELPPIQELLLHVPMSPLQRQLYKGLLTKNVSSIVAGGSKTSLLNTVMQLRKCCNHPYMFDGVEPEPFVAGEHIVNTSGKLLYLDKLLQKLKKEGHRVLVFSQFTYMLDILQDYLAMRAWNCERLDGSVRGEERYEAVDTFQTDSDAFVFLLSTRSGGVGLTLTAADTVVFFDSDWNPQMDLQAQQRAHRIGQTRSVTIYRLVSEGTVEDAIIGRASKKMKMAESILETATPTTKEGKTGFSDGELRQLVNWSAATAADEGPANADDTKWDAMIKELSADTFLSKRIGFGEGGLEDQTNGSSNGTSSPQQGNALYQFEGQDFTEIVRKGEECVEKMHKDALMAGAEALGKRGERGEGGGTTTMAAVSLPTKIRNKLSEKERLAKLQKQWDKTDYTTLSLPLESLSDDDDAESKEDEEPATEEDEKHSVKHVTGDLTKPITVDGVVGPRVVFIPINNSGNWCNAGLFAAVAKVVPAMGKQYEAAKTNNDLRLGDAHLFKAPSMSAADSDSSSVYYCLAVIQRESSRNELDYKALDKVLHRLATFAASSKKHSTTVPSGAKFQTSLHLSQLAKSKEDAYNFDKLLRKHMTDCQCFVYHFSRRGGRGRRDDRPPRVAPVAAPAPTAPREPSMDTDLGAAVAAIANSEQPPVAKTPSIVVHPLRAERSKTAPPSFSQLSNGTFCLHGFGPEHGALYRQTCRNILLHGGVIADLGRIEEICRAPPPPEGSSEATETAVIIIPPMDGSAPSFVTPSAEVVALHDEGVPVVDPSWIEHRLAQP